MTSCPAQGENNGNDSTVALDECNEFMKSSVPPFQFIVERAAQCQVVVDARMQSSHLRPPGQAAASARSLRGSTFA